MTPTSETSKSTLLREPTQGLNAKSVLDIARNLLSSLYQFDRQGVWNSVTREIRDLFDAEMCSLFLVSDDPAFLSLRAQCVSKSEDGERSIEMRLDKVRIAIQGGGLTAHTARSENTIALNAQGIDESPLVLTRALTYLPSRSCYSVLLTPLRNRKGKLLGILRLHNKGISTPGEEAAFSKEDIFSVEVLAFEIVALLENANAFEVLRSLIGEVHGSGSTDRAVECILSCASKLIPADRAKLGLWSQRRKQLVYAGATNLQNQEQWNKGEIIPEASIMQDLWKAAVKSYLAAPEKEFGDEEVALNYEPNRCGDSEAKSSISVVLRAHRQPVGVLHLVSLSERAFDDLDRQTLKALAQNVSIAVESIGIPWPLPERQVIQDDDDELSIGEASGLDRSIIRHIPLVMWRKDKDGRLIWVNDEFCRQLKKTRGEVLGRTDFDLFPTDLAIKYGEGDKIAMQEGKFEDEDEPFELPNGPRSVIHVLKQRFHDHIGNIAGTQGVFFDVAGDKYRRLFRETPISIYELNALKQITHVNEAGLRMLGFERMDSAPKAFSELLDDPSTFDELLVDESLKEVADWFPINLRKRMGEILPVSIAVRKIFETTGKLKGYLCALREISAGAEIERALHEPDARYLSKMKDLGFPVFCLDINLKVRFVNKAFLKYERLSEDQVIGKTSEEIFGEIGRRYDEDNQRVIVTGKALDRIEGHPGKKIVRVLKFPLYDSNNALIGLQGVYWNWEDHEKAKIELANALNDAHEEYRQIVQRAGEGIFQSTLDGTIVSANPAMARLLNYSTVESLIQDKMAGLSRFALEAERNTYLSRLASTEPHYSTPFDYKVITKDGMNRWVTETFIKDSKQGRLVGFVMDITERVQSAEAKEKLLRMLAHQLRSPVWQCYERLNQWVHILDPQGKLGTGEVALEASKAAMIRGLARRTRGVAWSIDMMSTLAHSDEVEIDEEKLRPISPRQLNKIAFETALDVHLIRRVAAEAKQRMGVPSIVPKFDVRYDESFATNFHIAGDSSLIEQCVSCVIENAFKYSDPNHEIKIVCTPDEETVVLSVSNFPLPGLQIDEKTREMCRQMEWRADAARGYDADGTGLGLYLVDRVLQAHGGMLIIELTDSEGWNRIGLQFPLRRLSEIRTRAFRAPLPRLRSKKS